MAKEICTVCGREIDSRGMSGHMKTHIADEGDGTDGGVISYPSQDVSTHPEENESTDEIGAQGKPAARSTNAAHPKNSGVKKTVKKTVASKPANSPASKPDTRGERKTEQEHDADLKSAGHPKDSGTEEWQGFFR